MFVFYQLSCIHLQLDLSRTLHIRSRFSMVDRHSNSFYLLPCDYFRINFENYRSLLLPLLVIFVRLLFSMAMINQSCIMQILFMVSYRMSIVSCPNIYEPHRPHQRQLRPWPATCGPNVVTTVLNKHRLTCL